ncbi:MAG TPA: D-glucuronyl C5-epimerase family protein [Nitrososphaera sp.]|nr:D-glucuronyl C5-epimerase family protein [Nitrososphaera sp.]
MVQENPVAHAVPDDKGVMMFDYGANIGKVYNPTVLGMGGAKYYYDYKTTGSAESWQKFLNTADWLVQHATDKGSYSLWEYSFDWPYYKEDNNSNNNGFRAPYASALAQARGIDVLIKAYDETGNERYMQEARRAFGAFMVDYNGGGVASREGDDSVFLQILAKPGASKTYVLNSHTKSLLLIKEYYDYTRDDRAMLVFSKGLNWLRDNLPRYDAGDWSYYDLLGTTASKSYHAGQTKQIAQLYKITGEPILKEYSSRFRGYEEQQQK